MKRAESRRLWAERIAAWKASGLKQRAFCERESLPYKFFLWWRRQLRSHARDTGLVPVVTLTPVTAAAAKEVKPLLTVAFGGAGLISESVEIRLPGGRSLALRGPLDEAQLRRLIRCYQPRITDGARLRIGPPSCEKNFVYVAVRRSRMNPCSRGAGCKCGTTSGEVLVHRHTRPKLACRQCQTVQSFAAAPGASARPWCSALCTDDDFSFHGSFFMIEPTPGSRSALAAMRNRQARGVLLRTAPAW